MNLSVRLLASLLLITACAGAPAATPARPLGPGEQRVPVANWTTGWFGGGPQHCAVVVYPPGSAILHGSATDPRLVWMTREGRRVELGWPVGYSARFTPQLELIAAQGGVVGREGSAIGGGCETADPGVFSVELP